MKELSVDYRRSTRQSLYIPPATYMAFLDTLRGGGTAMLLFYCFVSLFCFLLTELIFGSFLCFFQFNSRNPPPAALHDHKHTELNEKKDRYFGGLNKMELSASLISEMKVGGGFFFGQEIW